MTGYSKPQRRWDWEACLTEEEEAVVRPLTEEADRIDARRRTITAIINPIRNRAIQRLKYRGQDR